jgi:hypothetical protein
MKALGTSAAQRGGENNDRFGAKKVSLHDKSLSVNGFVI